MKPNYDAMIEGALQENEEDESQMLTLQGYIRSRQMLIERWKEKREKSTADTPAFIPRIADEPDKTVPSAKSTSSKSTMHFEARDVTELFTQNEFKKLTQRNAAIAVVKRVVQKLERPISIDESLAALDWAGVYVGGKTRTQRKQNMSTLLKRGTPELMSAGRGFYTVGTSARIESTDGNGQNGHSGENPSFLSELMSLRT